MRNSRGSLPENMPVWCRSSGSQQSSWTLRFKTWWAAAMSSSPFDWKDWSSHINSLAGLFDLQVLCDVMIWCVFWDSYLSGTEEHCIKNGWTESCHANRQGPSLFQLWTGAVPGADLQNDQTQNCPAHLCVWESCAHRWVWLHSAHSQIMCLILGHPCNWFKCFSTLYF